MTLQFTFGAPVPPALFFNREEEVKQVLKRITTIKRGIRNDLALIGPRRVGKSSLLTFIEKKLETQNITPIKFDCEGHDLFSFLKAYGNSTLDAELKQRGFPGLKERLKKGFTETIVAFSEALGIKTLEVSLSDFIRFRIEIEKNSTQRALTQEEIRTLSRQTFELPEKLGKKYVVMFDEFQETKNFSFPGNFYAYLRNITQNQMNVNYIYTGSAIGMIQEIFGDPDNPLAGNVELVYIEPFTLETTKSFLQIRLKKMGKSLSSQSLDFIYHSVDGFPAYLNWMGLKMSELSPKKGEIPFLTVKEAFEKMLSFQSPIYQMIERQLIRLGRTTKNILYLIAYGYHFPQEISRESEVKNIYVYLNRLEKYGLLQKKENKFELIDPVIKEYLKRK